MIASYVPSGSWGKLKRAPVFRGLALADDLDSGPLDLERRYFIELDIVEVLVGVGCDIHHVVECFFHCGTHFTSRSVIYCDLLLLASASRSHFNSSHKKVALTVGPFHFGLLTVSYGPAPTVSCPRLRPVSTNATGLPSLGATHQNANSTTSTIASQALSSLRRNPFHN